MDINYPIEWYKPLEINGVIIENEYDSSPIYDEETGYWEFSTTIKSDDEFNYDYIMWFVEEMIPYLIEKTEHIETMNTFWVYSTLYELKDGKIIEVDPVYKEYKMSV